MSRKKEKLFTIVKGFNVTDESGEETRFDPKPNHFITEKDFAPDQWKALVKMEAVVPFDDDAETEEPLPDKIADPLLKMSKAELVTEATRLRLKVTPDSMTNDTIIKMIRAAQDK